jgi:hypothetical protein
MIKTLLKKLLVLSALGFVKMFCGSSISMMFP